MRSDGLQGLEKLVTPRGLAVVLEGVVCGHCQWFIASFTHNLSAPLGVDLNRHRLNIHLAWAS